MRKVTIILSILALVASGCKGNKTQQTANNEIAQENLITTAGVGIFQYEKPIPFDNKDYTIKRETFEIEGDEQVIFNVFQNGEQLVEITPIGEKYDKVGRHLKIFSSKFKTSEGIGVGSTIEEFFLAYPNSKVRLSCAGWFNQYTNQFYIHTELENGMVIYAELSSDDFLKKVEDFCSGRGSDDFDGVDLQKSDFKKGAKVSELNIL